MIKVAMIGAGYMAREHARAISSIAGVNIIGAMGRKRDRAQSFCSDFRIDVCAQSVLELYERTQANAVIIAVNELSSSSIILEALNFPWTILAEKPISLKLEEVEQIEKKRAKLGRELFVALNRRHYGSTIATQKLLKGDKNIRVVEIHDQENTVAAIESGTPKEVVSNWMVANSIHLVDYLNVFCRGELLSLSLIEEFDPEKPFFIMATAKFDSGDLGIYKAFWNSPGPWSVKITTREQLLEMRPLESLQRQVFPEKIKKEIPLPGLDKEYKPGIYHQAEQLIAAVNKENHSLPSVLDYIETHQLVKRLYPNRISI